MDHLDVLRFLSVACLAVWCGVGGVVIPLLWQRRWRDHELLGLLLFIAAMFILQATLFVETSFALTKTDTQISIYRVFQATILLRVTSIAAAFSIIFVFWNVVRKG